MNSGLWINTRLLNALFQLHWHQYKIEMEEPAYIQLLLLSTS